MRLQAIAFLGLGWAMLGVPVSLAQYVQIPATPVQGQAFPPQSTFASPSPTMSAPSLAPSYGTAPIGPPPAFDSYANPSVSGTMTAPPSSVPYSYTPQAAPGGFPQQPAPNAWQAYPAPQGGYPAAGAPQSQSIYSNGLPYDWQQGTYGYQGADGSLVRFQKFLQRIGTEYTWIAGSNSPGKFGISRIELAATFGIPVMHNIDTPLLITPGFAVDFFEGPLGDPTAMPRGPDLPGQVYDAYLDFSWYPRPFEWFGAELGVRTGVWTDFNTMNSDSVRILGRGLGVISITPQMDILVGVVYLDRLRVKLLPAGGLHWRPNQDWDLYLVFPNPKIRRRFRSVGNTDWWWYVAGEYGGGSWTVDRVGLSDRIDYNDLRAILGLEFETPTMVRGHFEIGYVFDREILFNSGDPPEFKPDDSVMLRAGLDF
ncbi:hypothetical protein [Aeoliella sp.]|uniref:hypothetical protein n=1 Tax=Aeoliella sp. TaxID=2795800 RepID=UPI003CCC2B2E